MAKQVAQDSHKQANYTVAARREQEPDWIAVRRWCRLNDQSFSMILNMFMPAIAQALEHNVETDKDGNMFIRANFGKLPFLKSMSELCRIRQQAEVTSGICKYSKNNLVPLF